MKAVAALVDEAIGAGVFPGAALVVTDQGRRVLDLVAGARSLKGPPIAPTTLFDVASLTKPLVTATLCLPLDPDTPSGLPGVTVRHLLTHSSGLPAWRPLYQSAHDRQAIVALAAAAPLERPPGTASVYSDLGFIVLGDLLERTFHRRLDELAGERVLQDTSARFVDLTTADRPADVAATETGVPPGEVHDENCHAAGGILGHAGLFATGADVATLADTLVTRWHAGEPAVRRMWTPSTVPHSTWCLGWDRPAPTGSSAGVHWPRTGVGHLGFTGCSIWIDPPRRRHVVLLTNRVHPTRANDAIKAFRPRLHDAVWQVLGD